MFHARAQDLKPPAIVALIRSALPLASGIFLAFLMARFLAPAVGQYYEKVMMDAGIAIILAVSLNIVNGYTGQFSIGHAGFMAVGAYTAAAITYYGSMMLWDNGVPPSPWSGQLLFLWAILLGGLMAAVAGLLVGLPTLRLSGDYLAIVTLGFGEIVRVLIQCTDDVLYFPDEVRQATFLKLATSLGGSLGFMGVPFFTNILWVYGSVAVVLIVAYRLKYSSTGRAYFALREDGIAAQAVGVPITRYRVHAFVVASFFAGVAGALFAHTLGITLNPAELGFMKSFILVMIVVLGGMGSISGSVVAAIILTVLPEVLREFEDYRMIVYSALLIGMMLVRPQGLFGIYEFWELPILQRFRRAHAAPVEDSAEIPVLDISNLSLSFGGLKAVSDFRITLPEGVLHGLIGPNGAGKTTVFNLLTGVYRPDTGLIRLEGRKLNRLPPDERAKAGIARTFQNIRLFGNLTVYDNIRIACHLRTQHAGLFSTLLRLAGHRGEERAIRERTARLLKIFDLLDKANEAARNLPYGHQRRLEIARAIATGPTLLLLDEPAAGMNPHEKKALAELIRFIRKEFRLTVLLIEHDMGLVMELCDRITVLDHGAIIAEGTPEEVQKDPKVIEAYLGVPTSTAAAQEKESSSS